MEIKGRNGRKLSGRAALLIYVVAVLMAIFQIYYVSIGVIDPWLFRGGHLTFALVLVFLLTPATKHSKKTGFTPLDLLFAVLAVGVYLYLIKDLEGLNLRAGVAPSGWDIIIALLAIFLVIEGSRRYFGLVLPLVAGAFLLYAYFGYLMPGKFAIPQYSIARIASYIFSTTGIYGIALSTSATYVFLFVMFGVFLMKTGVGDVFMELAKAVAGGFRGGPAKVAVVSSALFGSISGSASSNVVTTGSFTIPLMRQTGYKGEFAAGVETAASIGGLFLPPIMGAGGFLMADILQIPYWEVARAAVIPAVLYYIVIFILVDFEAVRLNLKGITREQLPDLWQVVKTKGHLLFPVLVLLYVLLVIKASPVRAGLWSIAASIVVSWLRPETRIDIKKLADILSESSRQALNVAAATACAGIIVGVVRLTGLGLTFSSVLMSVGGSSLILSLIIAMAIAIVLGMGLPINATYITLAAVVAPALVNLDIPPIAAHLFLYFFAAVSGMTPPVCVTAYAAAGVSGEDPIRVGVNAMKLGWAAYVLPFMFVFGPSLLLAGSIGRVIISIGTALIGSFAIAAAIHGVLNKPLTMLERLLFASAGLLLVHVGNTTNYVGIAILAMTYILFRWRTKTVGNQGKVNVRGS